MHRRWTDFRGSLAVPLQHLNRLRTNRRAQDVVTAHAQVTPEWLTRILRENGHLKRERVVKLEFRETATLLTSEFAYLQATYSGPVELPERFFLKTLRQGSADKWVKYHKREAKFYRHAEKLATLETARCFDERHSSDWTKGHLLLQDMTTTHDRWWDMPESKLPGGYAAIVTQLARLHAFWWQHPLLGTDFAPFPQDVTMPEELDLSSRQLDALAVSWRDALAAPQRAFLYKLLQPAVWQNLWAWTRPRARLTLEHGQPHPTNFLFRRDEEPTSALLIDWQSYHVGLGAFDLAYLFVWFMDPARRDQVERNLLDQYYSELCHADVKNYSFAQFELDYRWGVARMMWMVLKLGAEAGKEDKARGQLQTTWRAVQVWDGEGLVQENKA